MASHQSLKSEKNVWIMMNYLVKCNFQTFFMDFKIYSLTISKPVELSKSYIATRLDLRCPRDYKDQWIFSITCMSLHELACARMSLHESKRIQKSFQQIQKFQKNSKGIKNISKKSNKIPKISNESKRLKKIG